MVMMTWLASVLRKAGLAVEEAPNWQQNGRGEMSTVRGILCHHTAGPMTGDRPSLNTVRNGRLDLPGPLLQLFLTRAGVFIVLAAGRCNHAGAGIWQGVATGNSSFIGIEAENAGRADDLWPAVQMDAYVRGCAAILAHIGADAVMVAGHREYATPRGRKIDPLFDMVDFRDHVEDAIGRGGAIPLAAVTVASVFPSRVMLRKGDQGESVRDLQVAINRWLVRHASKALPDQLVVDAAFGPTTLRAVEAVQQASNLMIDGFVGPQTWKAIDA